MLDPSMRELLLPHTSWIPLETHVHGSGGTLTEHNICASAFEELVGQCDTIYPGNP